MNPRKKTPSPLLVRCAVIASPVVLFAILWMVHWFYDPRVSLLERQARQYVGWSGIGAVDCGSAYFDAFSDEHPTGEHPAVSEAIRKVSATYKQGKPFSFRYVVDESQYDGQDEYIVIGTRAGSIFEFLQITREGIVRPVSIHKLSHLRDGNFETNLKHYFETGN